MKDGTDLTLGKFLSSREVFLINILKENVCGHLFECLDYYMLLSQRSEKSVGIYLAYDNFSKDDLENLVEDRYSLSSREIKALLKDTYIQSIKEFRKTRIIRFTKHQRIIFTDAQDYARIMNDTNMVFSAPSIIGLRCGIVNEQFKKLSDKVTKLKINFKVFQDFRIYTESLYDIPTRNHKKRLYFKSYKHLDKEDIAKNTGFIYLSTECRSLDVNYLKKIVLEHPELSKIYVAVLNKDDYPSLNKVEYLVPPVKNFHEKFDTFIYVPIARKFDCSPRLLPECTFYNKNIIFHGIDKDYGDLGLYWRYQDCKENMGDLTLDLTDLVYLYAEGNNAI